MKGRNIMTTANFHSRLFRIQTGFTCLSLVCLLAVAPIAFAQTTVTTKAKSFPSAEEAANALIEAAEKYDEQSLLAILGPESYDIIHTGEPARDREVAQKFAAEAAPRTTWRFNQRTHDGPS
jgi:hypothetical protein